MMSACTSWAQPVLELSYFYDYDTALKGSHSGTVDGSLALEHAYFALVSGKTFFFIISFSFFSFSELFPPFPFGKLASKQNYLSIIKLSEEFCATFLGINLRKGRPE